MDCQECNKRPATVHLTKIINNNKSEVHLCEHCAKEKGDTPQGFSFQDLLAGLLNYDQNKLNQSEKLQCETCGMSYAEFHKAGKLGCADCYKYFANQLDHILHRVQGKLGHTGKIPNRIAGDIVLKRKITELRHLLQRKVYDEDFEEAAKIRDEIREIEAKIAE